MPSDATTLLRELESGAGSGADRLAPLVYDELRRLAGVQLSRERAGHTLQATALAHEVYLRLVDQTQVNWQGRAHFMGVAAQMIRRILVDHARARATVKRGGDVRVLPIDDVAVFSAGIDFDILALHEALAELGLRSERQARVVELKFFAGLENREIAEAMGISETVVKTEWRFARAWLANQLQGDRAG